MSRIMSPLLADDGTVVSSRMVPPARVLAGIRAVRVHVSGIAFDRGSRIYHPASALFAAIGYADMYVVRVSIVYVTFVEHSGGTTRTGIRHGRGSSTCRDGHSRDASSCYCCSGNHPDSHTNGRLDHAQFLLSVRPVVDFAELKATASSQQHGGYSVPESETARPTLWKADRTGHGIERVVRSGYTSIPERTVNASPAPSRPDELHTSSTVRAKLAR